MLHKKQFARGAGISAALAFAVLAAGCGNHGATNYAPVANFEFGQPNWNNTTANRGLNNVAAANSLNSPGNAATNAGVAATVTPPQTVQFYIADTANNRVLGFNGLPTNGNVVANFVIGQTSLTSNTPGFLTSPLQLSSPTKVSISPDGTKLLVVDSSNNRVLIWNSLPTATTAGNAPDIILGDGGTTVTASTLNAPFGATFAPNAANPNRVIVADTGNNRVLVFNSPQTVTALAAVPGSVNSADFVLGQRAMAPVTTTPSSTGNSPNCPQLTTSITIACDNSNFQVGPDTLQNPGDVMSDGFKLVIADTGNGRVLYYPTMPTATGAQASYVIGQTVMTTRTTSGGGAAGFTTPTSVWFDVSNIYVADTGNNRVLAFRYPASNGTSAVSVYGQGDFVHVTANDDDQNNVPDKDGNGRPQASDRTLFAPGGMVTVASGSSSLIYVLDSGNNRMMQFNTY